jgi:hypothetical protein
MLARTDQIRVFNYKWNIHWTPPLLVDLVYHIVSMTLTNSTEGNDSSYNTLLIPSLKVNIWVNEVTLYTVIGTWDTSFLRCKLRTITVICSWLWRFNYCTYIIDILEEKIHLHNTVLSAFKIIKTKLTLRQEQKHVNRNNHFRLFNSTPDCIMHKEWNIWACI